MNSNDTIKTAFLCGLIILPSALALVWALDSAASPAEKTRTAKTRRDSRPVETSVSLFPAAHRPVSLETRTIRNRIRALAEDTRPLIEEMQRARTANEALEALIPYARLVRRMNRTFRELYPGRREIAALPPEAREELENYRYIREDQDRAVQALMARFGRDPAFRRGLRELRERASIDADGN